MVNSLVISKSMRSLALKAKKNLVMKNARLLEVKTKSTPCCEEDDENAKDETCLMAQTSNVVCLGVDLEPDEWIKDSGCSKHKTGNRKLSITYKAYNGCNVIFGSNLCGNIIGKVVPAGSTSSVPADYVSAGHVLVSADRDRIC
ncbi:hypothetical protein Tco_0116902 [Tanacetum coccineum]